MAEFPTREALLPTFESAFDFAVQQARGVLTKYGDYQPMYTVDGRWNREGEKWTHWCEGFYPGIYWLIHKRLGEPSWRMEAERFSRNLEPRRFDRNVHDL